VESLRHPLHKTFGARAVVVLRENILTCSQAFQLSFVLKVVLCSEVFREKCRNLSRHSFMKLQFSSTRVSLRVTLLNLSTFRILNTLQMANVKAPPRHIELYRQAKNFALFDHPLSKYGPPLLLLADALLTSVIISKIACKFHLNCRFLFEFQLIGRCCRHGD